MSSGDGWSAIATWRPTSSRAIGMTQVLTGHGIGNEVQRLRLGVGLTKVGDLHPVELGSGRDESVLVENPHADEHVTEVAHGRGIRRQRNLELCLGHEVALEQHLLETKVGPSIELGPGARRRPNRSGIPPSSPHVESSAALRSLRPFSW